MAFEAISPAEMPLCGSSPAWLERPVISARQRAALMAPITISLGFCPSRLKPIAGLPRSFKRTIREPCSPFSSAIGKSRVIGGWGSLLASSVSTSVTIAAQPERSSPPNPVWPFETTRLPFTMGSAPLQSGTVSMCAENRMRGAFVVPGIFTIRLPISNPSPSRLCASSVLIHVFLQPAWSSFFVMAATTLDSCPPRPSMASRSSRWVRAWSLLIIVSFLCDGYRKNIR